MAHTKLLSDYEKDFYWVGGCLYHPTCKSARVIYQKRHGNIDDSAVAVCHTCDNPTCLNDEHHFLGTWKDNILDAVRKGRHSCFDPAVRESIVAGVKAAAERGAFKGNGGKSRVSGDNMTAADVRIIKNLWSHGYILSEVADISGRSASTCNRVRNGEYDRYLQ